jgi:hypothetical protein
MQITTENKNKYKNITDVSFMIFRTGSVLIVGMCDEEVLYEIYNFLKALLKAEFNQICQKLITDDNFSSKDKKKKLRKKTINIVSELVLETTQINNIKYDINNIDIDEMTVQDIIVNKPKSKKNIGKSKKSKKQIVQADGNL